MSDYVVGIIAILASLTVSFILLKLRIKLPKNFFYSKPMLDILKVFAWYIVSVTTFAMIYDLIYLDNNKNFVFSKDILAQKFNDVSNIAMHQLIDYARGVPFGTIKSDIVRGKPEI